MLSSCLALVLSVIPSDPPVTPEPIALEASLPAQLAPGLDLELRLELSFGSDHEAPPNPFLGGASEPAAMLQLWVPDGVALEGPELRTLPELLGAMFLDRPYEQLLRAGEHAVRFRLLREPNPDERIELNLLTYLKPRGGEGTDGVRLLRRRFAIPLEPGGRSQPADASRSSWGRGDFLQLGDQAVPFELKTPFGTPAVLDDFLGDGPLMIVTYRSCL